MTTQTQVLHTEEALSVYDTLKLALEALETAWYHVFCPTDKAIELYDDARAAIKAALEAHKALMSLQDGAQPEQVTDEENERFSDTVSNFKGADPEATKYALEEFLRNRVLAQPKEPEQEPVNEGWKLVPVKPTEDMWKAVNKLDDEMAAGNYDGKGCSIEQAWNCLLDAAPTPPTQQSCSQRPSRSDMTWVGLTHEDIDKAIEDNQRFGGFRKVGFAYDLELVLKEKNTK